MKSTGEGMVCITGGCALAGADTTAGLAIHYVRRALEMWEPRARIVRLDAGRHPELPHRLDIVLDYRVRGGQRLQRLAFPVELAGEER